MKVQDVLNLACLFLVLRLVFVCCLSGCSPKEFLGGQASKHQAAIHIADADVSMTRPALPDDLQKKDNVGEGPVVRKVPEVLCYVYAPSWCSGCKPIKKEIVDSPKIMNGPPLTIQFVFVHDWDRIPAFAKEWVSEGQTWPVFHFKTSKKGWRKFSGWKGLQEFIKVIRMYEEDAQPVEAVPSNAKIA